MDRSKILKLIKRMKFEYLLNYIRIFKRKIFLLMIIETLGGTKIIKMSIRLNISGHKNFLFFYFTYFLFIYHLGNVYMYLYVVFVVSNEYSLFLQKVNFDIKILNLNFRNVQSFMYFLKQ